MRRIIISLLFLTFWGIVSPVWASAQFKPGSVLLDDETDAAFQEWIRKIFAVAGLRQYHPRIYIIVNHEVNAAASLGGHIYIYSEFLMKCDNADQFLGVMAHEVGHIAGGHISRMDGAMDQSMVPAAAAVILGGALALASGSADPLMAGLAGGGHIMERGMLKFTRTQESAADQAGLSYLEKLGWPADGLGHFLEKVEKMYGSSSRLDPYSTTHPVTPDRIQSILNHNIKCGHQHRSVPAEIESKFQRIKAKMMAYLDPSRALSIYKDNSLASRYARAIAQYRLGQFASAIEQINILVKENPKDPYFHELKGQILFETGDIEGAVPALRAAIRPNTPLVKIMLAHALLERKTSPGYEETISILQPITQKHPQDYPMAWRLLATAYGKNGQMGEASLALAEEAYLKEDYPGATSFVNRAIADPRSNPKTLTKARDLLAQIKHKSAKGGQIFP
jgi:predicted Zn-dependent protease